MPSILPGAGYPRDIANACLFLFAHEENDFVNGHNLVVDGGMTKRMILTSNSGFETRRLVNSTESKTQTLRGRRLMDCQRDTEVCLFRRNSFASRPYCACHWRGFRARQIYGPCPAPRRSQSYPRRPYAGSPEARRTRFLLSLKQQGGHLGTISIPGGHALPIGTRPKQTHRLHCLRCERTQDVAELAQSVPVFGADILVNAGPG